MGQQFVKVISPGGYDFGESRVQIVKVAAAGLRGHDFRELVKRAGHSFADQIKRAEMKPGDEPVHLLAVGATEFYGPNRNGDGFKQANCRKHHGTFVKFARWYRNHENKNPDKSWGLVKLSDYNERMHRIELLAVLNGTKEAADRNGGFVATEELEKLARGEDIPVSMACRLPYDVCSGCGNKARNRDEYCTGVDEGGFCKAGGLRNRIATVTGDDDHPILHADNPDPLFFDISRVPRPADRIAYTMGLVKAASNDLLGGAAIAEAMHVTAPIGLDDDGESGDMLKLAVRLAAAERSLAGLAGDRWLLAFGKQSQAETTWHDHGGQLDEVMRALVRERISLPVDGFLEIVNRDPVKAAAVAPFVQARLPGIYGRMVESGEIHDLVSSSAFAPSDRLPPMSVRNWASKRASSYSLEKTAVEKRVWLGAVKQGSTRPAREPSDAPASAETVAKQYSLYKLAFLNSLGDVDDLTLWLAVAQNYI